MSAAQLQTVFFRLVGSSSRIIHIGRPRLLNVRPQDVRNRMRPGKLRQAPGAGGIHRQVRFVDIQPARIKTVPRQQQPGAAIIDGDARGVMPGDREDVEDPATEVDQARVLRPF